jgi:hypothetical protein
MRRAGHRQWRTVDHAGRWLDSGELPSGCEVDRALSGEPFNLATERAEDMWQLAYGYDLPNGMAAALDSWRQDARAKGATPRGDEEYVVLAVRYVALASTHDEAPIRSLARQLGKSKIAIRQALREARGRGLLTQAANGVAGGQLSPKARRIFRQVLNRRSP